MADTIDLNSILPSGTEFTPLFDSEEEFSEFKERYRKEVHPQLKQQEEDRRQSEEEARHRILS